MCHSKRMHDRVTKTIIFIAIIVLSIFLRSSISNEGVKANERDRQAQSSFTPSLEIEKPAPQYKYIRGEASYYSENGCLGCSETLTMANNERLNDEIMTIALLPDDYTRLKNKYVLIINDDNYLTVVAKVTDTGGFGKYNRVADLSLATATAIKCGSKCNVSIREK